MEWKELNTEKEDGIVEEELSNDRVKLSRLQWVKMGFIASK